MFVFIFDGSAEVRGAQGRSTYVMNRIYVASGTQEGLASGSRVTVTLQHHREMENGSQKSSHLRTVLSSLLLLLSIIVEVVSLSCLSFDRRI
jgi:hypothetical protein